MKLLELYCLWRCALFYLNFPNFLDITHSHFIVERQIITTEKAFYLKKNVLCRLHTLKGTHCISWELIEVERRTEKKGRGWVKRGEYMLYYKCFFLETLFWVKYLLSILRRLMTSGKWYKESSETELDLAIEPHTGDCGKDHFNRILECKPRCVWLGNEWEMKTQRDNYTQQNSKDRTEEEKKMLKEGLKGKGRLLLLLLHVQKKKSLKVALIRKRWKAETGDEIQSTEWRISLVCKKGYIFRNKKRGSDELGREGRKLIRSS